MHNYIYILKSVWYRNWT